MDDVCSRFEFEEELGALESVCLDFGRTKFGKLPNICAEDALNLLAVLQEVCSTRSLTIKSSTMALICLSKTTDLMWSKNSSPIFRGLTDLCIFSKDPFSWHCIDILLESAKNVTSLKLVKEIQDDGIHGCLEQLDDINFTVGNVEKLELENFEATEHELLYLNELLKSLVWGKSVIIGVKHIEAVEKVKTLSQYMKHEDKLQFCLPLCQGMKSRQKQGLGSLPSCSAEKRYPATLTRLEMLCGLDAKLPQNLRNLESRLIEHVSNEMMDRDPNVHWNDIAGWEDLKMFAKTVFVKRSPGNCLLLFSPPGIGKRTIGKAIATEAEATFFYISERSLTRDWVGEGEKLVTYIFHAARDNRPAIIFIDDVDSLLSQRESEGEHGASLELKTQLLEMMNFARGSLDILLIGATERPQELNEKALELLTIRLFVPLPEADARECIIRSILDKNGLFSLSKEDMTMICQLTEGYSESDMIKLVNVALDATKSRRLNKEDMGRLTLQDFMDALQKVKPSVSADELGTYAKWNEQFGSLSP